MRVARAAIADGTFGAWCLNLLSRYPATTETT